MFFTVLGVTTKWLRLLEAPTQWSDAAPGGGDQASSSAQRSGASICVPIVADEPLDAPLVAVLALDSAHAHTACNHWPSQHALRDLKLPLRQKERRGAGGA